MFLTLHNTLVFKIRGICFTFMIMTYGLTNN